MSAARELLRQRLLSVVADIWENDEADVDVQTLIDDAGLGHLVDVLERTTDNLRIFIADHDDPGVEALGALWEAEQILGRGPTADEVARQPAFPRLVTTLRTWRDDPTDDHAQDMADVADELIVAVETATAQKCRLCTHARDAHDGAGCQHCNCIGWRA